MPGTMDNIATLNSVVRTILAVAILGAVGGGGLIAYRVYNNGDKAAADLADAKEQLADASKKLASVEANLKTTQGQLAARDRTITEKNTQIGQLEETVEEQTQRIERLEIARRLLKKDHRRALVRVLEQRDTDDGVVTKIRWVELNDRDEIIDDREFEIKGDILYVDAWVVKFEDKYIEEADLLRGTSICWFRGIHGEFAQAPDVHVLDQVDSPPSAYKRGPLSDFEREIWDDFWEIHHNEEQANAMGIRALHGVEVYNKVRQGETYKIELRTTGDPTIKQLGENEPDPTAKPAA